MFEKFILSDWKNKPECYWNVCSYCFQNQYCHDFLNNIKITKLKNDKKYFILKWEEFPSLVYKKYWESKRDFINYLEKIKKKELINVPKCLWWTWIYQTYNDIKKENTLEDYTKKYINNLYRKKSLRCKKCKYYDKCEWIHINFIRSFGFSILEPIEE